MSLRDGDWGTITAGETRIPVTLAVTVAGAGLWLVVMLVNTGSAGVDSLWSHAAYLVPLVLLCSATRTVSLRELVTLFLWGGFMLGVVLVVGQLYEAVDDDPLSTQRDFAIPIIEEALKLLPVVAMVWLGRRDRTWSLGATDLLLMGAAAGAGFGLVEDAFIRDRYGWPDQIGWLPLAEKAFGRVIAGHAVWTSVAALGLGFALLLRSVPRAAAVAGVAGFAISAFEHVANNYITGPRPGHADIFKDLTADGWLAIWVLVIGTAVAIVADARIAYRTLPKLDELQAPPGITGPGWAFRMERRALAFAAFQHYRAKGPDRPGTEAAVESLAGSLYDRRFGASLATAADSVEPAGAS